MEMAAIRLISRKLYRLYLFSNGIKIDEFMVSTGKKSTPTQDGVYFIEFKTKNMDWHFGKIKDLIKLKFDKSPNCLIIPGKLHFVEEEVLENCLQ